MKLTHVRREHVTEGVSGSPLTDGNNANLYNLMNEIRIMPYDRFVVRSLGQLGGVASAIIIM